MNTPINLDALGKLLSLAKSLADACTDVPQAKAIERVLIRTTPDGQLTFQVKGGSFWRFFAITLPGREKEYDLGQNLLQLQTLFESLSSHSDHEIRRTAQGMAMYGDTVIDTTDAVGTLFSLQQTLNSLIDHIKQKKLRRQTDEERKKNIAHTLDAMKISFRVKTDVSPASVLPPKKVTKRKVVADKAIDELLEALEAKCTLHKSAYPYESAYTSGRYKALEHHKKELLLWQAGACAPSDALKSYRNVKDLLHDWNGAAPEVSQLKQQAQDERHRVITALHDLQDRLDKLMQGMQGQESTLYVEKVKKQKGALEKQQGIFLDEEQDGLLELFRRCGEHYLVLPQQHQLDVQALQRVVAGQKSVLSELEEAVHTLEREQVVCIQAVARDSHAPKKASGRKKSE